MVDKVEFPGLYPKFLLPIYPWIETSDRIEKVIGNRYEMIIHSPRETRKDVTVHEAILIAKERMRFEDVPDPLLALDAHAVKRSIAKKKVLSDRQTERQMVNVLIFLALEKTEEFVRGGWESLKSHEDEMRIIPKGGN